jgi:hypothetical protein
MKGLQLSISTLGVLVLLIAVDLAVLGSAFGWIDQTFLDLIALPIGNILVFAFYRARMIKRRGESSPFLFGFQVSGWAFLLAYLIWCRLFRQQTVLALVLALQPIRSWCMDNLGFDTMKRLDPTFALAWKISTAAMLVTVSIILTNLMLLAAVGGGMVARRWRRGANGPGPRQFPSSSQAEVS